MKQNARPLFLALTVGLAISSLAGCAQQVRHDAAPTAAAEAVAIPSAFEKAVERGKILVAGQPNEADLAALTERGFSHVVSLRSAEEMAGLGFSESTLLQQSSIDFLSLPVAASTDYTPAMLAQFAKTVEQSPGKVLLHCASGGRASVLYAAYAMKYLGLSPQEAAETLRASGAWPSPLERLTGEKLSLVRTDDLIKAGFESETDVRSAQ